MFNVHKQTNQHRRNRVEFVLESETLKTVSFWHFLASDCHICWWDKMSNIRSCVLPPLHMRKPYTVIEQLQSSTVTHGRLPFIMHGLIKMRFMEFNFKPLRPGTMNEGEKAEAQLQLPLAASRGWQRLYITRRPFNATSIFIAQLIDNQSSVWVFGKHNLKCK